MANSKAPIYGVATYPVKPSYLSGSLANTVAPGPQLACPAITPGQIENQCTLALPQTVTIEQTTELYAISEDELLACSLEAKVSQGEITREQADREWKKTTINAAKFAAKYATTATGVINIAKLAKEVGLTGKLYFKSYNGKQHVILKGYAGLRKFLTGTRYRTDNPKIVKMGIGRKVVNTGIRRGGILTMILLTGAHILEYILTDDMMLSELLGAIASDVIKVGISTAIAVGAVSLATGGLVISSFAVGPLIIALAIGIGVGVILDEIDTHYGLTRQLKASFAEYERQIRIIHHQASNLKNTIDDKIIDLGRSLASAVLRRAAEELEEFVLEKMENLRWGNVLVIPQLY